VELGVQNALRQRLLQLLDKPVLAEQLLRIASRQKLVHNLFLGSHLMILLSISMASRTQFLTVLNAQTPAHHSPSSNGRSSGSSNSHPLSRWGVRRVHS